MICHCIALLFFFFYFKDCKYRMNIYKIKYLFYFFVIGGKLDCCKRVKQWFLLIKTGLAGV
ncbi:hypothetical protein MuYL_1354 [Mucilaginibacter xinganensis]|uniref:Uncharacterized protein n=1 Tax=Mucilaginibacter xinganensis TaxID=1234841 RepID=A0A223NTP8_9SPHI|nr:hypothetical protein MuYL_1354 [Mucilaginibacter xinganensis]